MDLFMNPERFLKDVEENAVLYDKEHPLYDDLQLKDELWEAIGRKHKMSGDQSETFWISIITRHLMALGVVKVTNYIPKEMVIYSQNFKFMEKHFQDFVLDPFYEHLITDITREVKLDVEQEQNEEIPENLQTILRQEKLKTWTDRTMTSRHLSDNIPQYQEVSKEDDDMDKLVEFIIRREEAMIKKRMQRRLA